MSAALHARTPTLSAFDPRGLAVRQLQWCRAEIDAEPESRITHQRFDTASRVTEHRDPRLFASPALRPNLSTTYSLSGNPLLTDSVDAGWRAMLPTEDGLPDRAWDGRNTLTRFEYDEVRRTIAIFETAETGSERCCERFIFGDAEAAPDFNLRQRPIRHDDPAGTRHMLAYDLNSLPQQERQHFLASLDPPNWPLATAERDALLERTDGLTTQWRYSPWAEQLSMTDVAGNQHRQQLSMAGRLARSTLLRAGEQQANVLVEHITYNAFDQVQTQVAGNGLISEIAYDPANGKLTRLRCKSASKSLQDLTYEYDPAGNVTRHEDQAIDTRYHGNRRIDPVCEFRYDSLYQLIEASGRERLGAGRGPDLPDLVGFSADDQTLVGAYTRHYQYDASGNLLLMQHRGQNNQDHSLRMAVSEISNKSIPWREGLTNAQIEESFDTNGNLDQLQPGQNLTWDLRNQLAQVLIVQREEGTSDAERYIYGGGGKRLRKHATRQASGVTHHTETRYLPNIELHEDTATGQHWQVININAGRGKVRLLHWLTDPPAGMQNNTIYYGFDNLLGSVTLEADEEGQLVSREEYYPFGGTALLAARSEAEVSFKTIRYSGKERDATGLYYYGYRYLAPWTGSWLNPDPAGISDGLNLFCFIKNSPTSWVDGNGLMMDPPSDDESEASFDFSLGSPAPSLSGIELDSFNSPLSPTNSLHFPTPQSTPARPRSPTYVDAFDTDRFNTPVPSPFSVVSVDIQMFGSRPASPQPGPSNRLMRPPPAPKQHKCPQCNMLFNKQSNLKRHILVHTGEKPYKCTEPGCEIRFSQKQNLTAHMRLHTNEKRYKCDECGHSFNQRPELTRHLRTHTGERPHVCDVCGYSSSFSGNLKRHKRGVHRL